MNTGPLCVCVCVFTCVASYGESELVVFIPNLLLVPVVCCLPSSSPLSAQNQSQQKAITHQARDLFTILNYLSLRLNYINQSQRWDTHGLKDCDCATRFAYLQSQLQLHHYAYQLYANHLSVASDTIYASHDDEVTAYLIFCNTDAMNKLASLL